MNMIGLGIDPGPEWSAYVLQDMEGHNIIDAGILENDLMLRALRLEETYFLDLSLADCVIIEDMTPRQKVTGKTVWDSLRWIGRFHEAWMSKGLTFLLSADWIRETICGTRGATAADKQSMLIHLIQRQHKISAGQLFGDEDNPGPLYKIVHCPVYVDSAKPLTEHIYSALAAVEVFKIRYDQNDILRNFDLFYATMSFRS